MPPIKCPYCGAETEDWRDYCSGCGGPLAARSRAIKKALEERDQTTLMRSHDKDHRLLWRLNMARDLPDADSPDGCLKFVILVSALVTALGILIKLCA
ncbi:MAG: hypothetical protein LBR53_02855 [Deltaproteobacteria bacterium]|jgi:ribosomal protein L37E|nr:hypothetical protein [Deltaproteobacteria bacterium]